MTHAVRLPRDHAAGVICHLLDGHRERGRTALQHRAERVSDEQGVDAGVIQDAREGRVVAGQHGDLFAGGVHLAKAVQGDGLAVAHALL